MVVDKKIVGMNIKQARKKKKMKQKELAELIGYTESSISKYEQGLVDIPNTVIGLIARVLDVTPVDLLGIPTINKRMKEVRESLHLSQEEFGNILGLSKLDISNLEDGTKNVNIEYIRKIGTFFNINEAWLMMGEPDCDEEYIQYKNLANYSTQELLAEIERRCLK